jgi:hypothetical protein
VSSVLPHLIHVGYPKAGSHFVQKWFTMHPQVAFVRNGFAGFRDLNDFARQSATGADALRWRVTSSETLSSPHPETGRLAPDRDRSGPVPEAQARACEMLAGMFPAATILLLTRGFRSVMLSGYSQYIRSGGEEDFYSLRPGAAVPQRGAAHSWDYDYILGLYRAAFGGRVIVLPYELLRDDAEAFAGELSRRLGIEPLAPPPGRQHPSLSPVEMRWYPRFTRTLRRLPLPARVRERIFASYVRSLRKGRLRTAVTVLQRGFPAEPVTDAMITDEMVELFRGRADSLAGEPHFAPYAKEYLFDVPPGAQR